MPLAMLPVTVVLPAPATVRSWLELVRPPESVRRPLVLLMVEGVATVTTPPKELLPATLLSAPEVPPTTARNSKAA